MSVERKRLGAYLENYEMEDSPEGMRLKVENHEGGGNNMPDESKEYENRIDWLEDDEETKKEIWRILANQQYKDVKPSENEELVYIKFPQWLLDYEDNEDWKALFGEIHGYYTGWAIIYTEDSENKNAWGFKKFVINNRWRKPRNKYRMLWGPKACFTLYRMEGEPENIDKEKVHKREALPEDVDAFEAEEEDYYWRYALGAAYRRLLEQEDEPLVQAREKAETLPDKLHQRLEIGVDEYMRISQAEGTKVTDEELAKVIESFYVSLKPGSLSDK